jgi:hypothetical protein
LGFDPSTSSDPAQQGFTTCEIDDLPCEIPARSKCDTLYDTHDMPTTAQRQKAFSMMDTDQRVSAYPAVQFGKKAGAVDVNDEGVVEMDHDD